MGKDIAFKILNDGSTNIPNVILYNYKKLGLNDTEFVFLIELLSVLKSENYILNFQEISQIMDKTDAEVYSLLNSLIQKGIISLNSVKDSQGRNDDKYSFTPLYKKIVKVLNENEKEEETKKNNTSREDVFLRIQREFGRQLSSFEIEMVDNWLTEDNYSAELIILALKEAILSNAYSLKYMDKILISWENRGIKNANDVQRVRDQRRGKEKPKLSGNTSKPKIPLIKFSNNN